MTSEAQKRAKAKYAKRCEKRYAVVFYPKDKEAYEFAKERGGAAYLRSLVYKEMGKEREES